MSVPYPVIVDVTDDLYSNRVVVGFADLVAGTATILYRGVGADTLIFLTAQAGTLNLGSIDVAARVLGVSFTVNSSNVLDTRRFAWMAIDP